MKKHLTVLFKSTPENTKALQEALAILVSKSKAESACLQYDLHQNNEDATEFILHETWENEAGLAQHNQQQHLKDFGAAAKELLAQPFQVYKTTLIA